MGEKIKFTASGGGGSWTPLPTGDYTVEFDSYEPTTSSGQHPQLHLVGHVIGGHHDGRSVHIYYTMSAKAGWKTQMLLEAALNDDQYEVIETEEVDAKGEPICEYEFDPDDLLGAQVLYLIEEGEYNGKAKNDYKNERPVAQESAPAEPSKTSTESLPGKADGPGTPTGRRRRRVAS